MTRGACALVLLVALLAGARPARAEDPPPAQQALLLLRILAYDRNLKTRCGGDKVVVGVVAKPGDRASEDAAAKLVRALADAKDRKTTVLGMEIDVMTVPFDPGLDERLAKARLAALYVAPGLEDSVGLITPLTKKHSVMSMAPRPDPARNGLAIGLELRDKRTAVIVNLQAARSEGVDFESAFLRVAEVIKP